MNPRISLIIIGIVLLFVGILPVIAQSFPSYSLSKMIPASGSPVYQVAMIGIGILALVLSSKKKETLGSKAELPSQK